VEASNFEKYCHFHSSALNQDDFRFWILKPDLSSFEMLDRLREEERFYLEVLSMVETTLVPQVAGLV